MKTAAVKPIQIMLIDDHSLVRDGIKALIEDEQDLDVVIEASGGYEGITKAAELDLDVIIIDIRMPDLSGIEVVKALVKNKTNARFLMLSMHDSEEYVLNSIAAGAHGYLLKDASKEVFLKAIRKIHEGGVYYSGDVSKYLLKDISAVNQDKNESSNNNISDALDQVAVTKKEMEILNLVTTGMSNQEIADTLGKSKRTIESHRFNLMRKMNVKNLMELTQKARKLGILK